MLTELAAVEAARRRSVPSKLRESRSTPHGGGQVTDAGELVNEGSGAVATLHAAYRFGDDQALVFEGDGFAGAIACVRSSVADALPDDGEPHRDAPAPGGAARGARRPRQAGGLGGSARQAPLRLLASPAAQRGGARGGRAPRQREGLRGDPRADVRDADRRGAKARGDDALRREVRRHVRVVEIDGFRASSAAARTCARPPRSGRS